MKPKLLTGIAVPALVVLGAALSGCASIPPTCSTSNLDTHTKAIFCVVGTAGAVNASAVLTGCDTTLPGSITYFVQPTAGSATITYEDDSPATIFTITVGAPSDGAAAANQPYTPDDPTVTVTVSSSADFTGQLTAYVSCTP